MKGWPSFKIYQNFALTELEIGFRNAQNPHQRLLQAKAKVVVPVQRNDYGLPGRGISVFRMTSVLRNEQPAVVIGQLCHSLARDMLHTATCIVAAYSAG